MKKAVLLVVLLLVFGGSIGLAKYLKVRSEGKWVCVNGEWAKQGNPLLPKPSESCRLKIVEDAKQKLDDMSQCVSLNGKTMTYAKAKEIAARFCKDGSLKDTHLCNSNTGTWWIDFSPNSPKKGCNPACVIDIEKETADINWRCTGLIETKI